MRDGATRGHSVSMRFRHPAVCESAVWSGNPRHANDENRSIPFAALLPLVAAHDATFVSVQPQIRARDADAFASSGVLSFADTLTDFAETAALVDTLDLVISVDTSVAHLAGALGRPVWMLLPRVPDWRWLLSATIVRGIRPRGCSGKRGPETGRP